MTQNSDYNQLSSMEIQPPDIENQITDTENKITRNLTEKIFNLQLKIIELKVNLEIFKKKYQYDSNYIFIAIVLTNLGYLINAMIFK